MPLSFSVDAFADGTLTPAYFPAYFLRSSSDLLRASVLLLCAASCGEFPKEGFKHEICCGFFLFFLFSFFFFFFLCSLRNAGLLRRLKCAG